MLLKQVKEVNNTRNIELAVEEMWNLRGFDRMLQDRQEGQFVWVVYAALTAQQVQQMQALIDDFLDGV